MTAAAADRRNYRSTNTELPATYRRLVAEAVTYYKGALIADVGGAARKVTGTSGLKIIGWCEQESFLGSTTDPAYMDVEVHSGLIHLALDGSNTPTATNSSDLMYAVDDQTVGTSSVGGTLSPVGRLVRIEEVNGTNMALVEVGLINNTVVDLAAGYVALADLASQATGAGYGGKLVGYDDASSFTTATNFDDVADELYQNALTAQAHLPIPLTSFLDADGDPLAKFVDAGSPTFGFNLANSEALNLRWNNDATPGTALCNVALPQDLDDTAAIVLHFLASKSGATIGDATTLTITAFFQTVAALHDADADCGGVTGALTGDATAKTVAELTLSIAAGDVPAAPCSLTFTVTPTAGLLGTDDLMIHAVWIEYKRKILTS